MVLTMRFSEIEKPILAIESTGTASSIAIGQKGSILSNQYFNSGKQGSELLSSTIDFSLKALNLKPQDLGAVCVSLGPGSFTALRISISTAEALRLALGIPLYGINTLHLIATGLSVSKERIRVIQDAYKGEFYSGTFHINQGEVFQEGNIEAITPENFTGSLKQGDLLCGSALPKLRRLNLAPNDDQIRIIDGLISIPDAAKMLDYFFMFPPAAPLETPVQPVYIRASEAEISYQKRFKIEHD